MTNQSTPGSPNSGLAPNVASLLCYVCGFITGIIFLIIEKNNKLVRFHAWQSIFFGVANFGLQVAISILAGILGTISSSLAMIVGLLTPLVGLVFLVFWIILMVKAYGGEQYKLPIIGDLAAKQAAK